MFCAFSYGLCRHLLKTLVVTAGQRQSAWDFADDIWNSEIYNNILDVFRGWLSSRTLAVVRRSMERDRHVKPPVRRLLQPSAGRLPVEERGHQSVKCQHSDILQPPSPGRRSCIYGARPDDQLHGGYSHCRLFGPARSGGLWRISTPVTRSSLRPTSSVGPGHWQTHGARPAHWTLLAIDGWPAQQVLEFISIDNWTINHLIPWRFH